MTKLRAFLLPLALALAALTQTAEAQTLYHGGAPGPFTTLGWNYGHIASCYTYFNGSTTWAYVYMQEGGYGLTNNPAFISSVAPACQSGKWVGVRVTSLNPFQWDMVLTYPN